MALPSQPFAAALSRPVPRYTSYPTALQFSDSIDAATYADWIGRVPADARLSLYLHVPYCTQLCWYCGCHTRVASRYSTLERYRDALRTEIRSVRRRLGAASKVTQIHWGGGTPTVLRPDDFRLVAGTVAENFDIAEAAEIAVEIDPRSFVEDMVLTLARTGVNRVSFGVQDFDPQVQAAINRLQPYGMTRRAIERLRDAGIASINLDLVYGLPRQTVDSLRRTVEQVIALAPDRLALFGYAHVPWMKPHQRLIDENELPGPDTRWVMATQAAAMLTEAGYLPVGIDHFARPGDSLALAAAAGNLRRNFQGYTTDEADSLLGFGASAISRLGEGYVQNTADVARWQDCIERGRLAAVRGIRLSSDDRRRAAMIERLMCDMAVDLRADMSLSTDEIAALQDVERLGIARVEDGVLRILPSARPLARIAAAAFDAYRAPGQNRHSAAI